MASLLTQVDAWAPDVVAVAVLDGTGVRDTHGPTDHVLPWASLTKLVTAYTTLTQVEHGVVHLDEPAGPDGSTVRHLLAHASGLPGLGSDLHQAVGARRMYSNAGYEALAQTLTERTGTAFEELVALEVLAPLGLTATAFGPDSWGGGAAAGLVGPLDDLVRLAAEFLAPTLIDASLFAEATTPQFPDLDGVVPGWGRQRPCPWGLGFEIKGAKSPHWTAPSGAPTTFGHYGGAGSFLWVDPVAGIAGVELASKPFGDWAVAVWPDFNEAVLATYG